MLNLVILIIPIFVLILIIIRRWQAHVCGFAIDPLLISDAGEGDPLGVGPLEIEASIGEKVYSSGQVIVGSFTNVKNPHVKTERSREATTTAVSGRK